MHPSALEEKLQSRYSENQSKQNNDYRRTQAGPARIEGVAIVELQHRAHRRVGRIVPGNHHRWKIENLQTADYQENQHHEDGGRNQGYGNGEETPDGPGPVDAGGLVVGG